jgi:ABC-type sugar transport system ATPase subunit
LNRLGLIDGGGVAALTDQFIGRLNIATASRTTAVKFLSGGNQQKVLLAKWLATGPKILILNDPTRGVDVGAKWEIYELCQQLASQGLVILFTSSEVDEVLGLADRVLVLAKGRLRHEFRRGTATKAQLMHAIAGGLPAPGDLTPLDSPNDNE